MYLPKSFEVFWYFLRQDYLSTDSGAHDLSLVLEGKVVGGDVVAGMEDLGIELGVNVVDVVIVMVAGALVMA